MTDSFQSHGTLESQGQTCKIARLGALEAAGHDLARLPYSLRVLLENLLRHEDGVSVTKEDIEALVAMVLEKDIPMASNPASAEWLILGQIKMKSTRKD